jgi:hypothetical protein
MLKVVFFGSGITDSYFFLLNFFVCKIVAICYIALQI